MSDTDNKPPTFDGVFRPARHDDLQPGVALFIGTRATWRRLWIVEDGPYAGQWACGPDWRSGVALPFAWAPECDFEIVEDGGGVSA